MRKNFLPFIILSVLLLSGCGNKEKNTENEEIVTTGQETVTTPVQTVTVTSSPVISTVPVTTVTQPEPESKPYLNLPLKEDELPSMDGSTSAIPLEAGIKAKLLGINYKNAKEKVVHNKTHIAFSNLLSGETDLIFSVPISESQQQDADDAGVHLNIVPVAKEAFVFIVNKNNPVSSLTQEQIRDIYSRKITNWSELGGNDEKIIPYQRNKDSGSQNYMDEFMEGYDFPGPDMSLAVGEMNAMIARVGTYDNAEAAIGYSVYSYAAQMYEDSDDIKLIAVDGIEPSKETLADGTYPLLSNTYIIHRDNPSEKIQKFIEWILSEEGQNCVLESGYLPVDDIEYPDYMKLYKAKGTGMEMPENYTPSRRCSVLSGYLRKDRKNELEFVKDEKLRKLIRNDISEFASETYASVQVYGENGYVSFEIALADYKRKCFTYDFINGERIDRFTDLFFKDSDFVPLLNKTVSHLITDEFGGFYDTNSDFLGVTGEIREFSLAGFQMPEKNPYYDYPKWFTLNNKESREFAYDVLPLAMITGEYHDFNDYITNTEHVAEISEKERPEWFTHSERRENGSNREVVYGSLYHTDREVKQRNTVFQKIIDHVEAYCEEPEVRKSIPNVPNNRDCYHVSNKYASESDYNLNIFSGYRCKSLIHGRSYYDHHYAGYDSETGEPLTFEDVFGPEFSDIDENYSRYTYSVSYEPNSSDCVRFEYDGGNNTEIPVVREHLNMKYFIPKE